MEKFKDIFRPVTRAEEVAMECQMNLLERMLWLFVGISFRNPEDFCRYEELKRYFKESV